MKSQFHAPRRQSLGESGMCVFYHFSPCLRKAETTMERSFRLRVWWPRHRVFIDCSLFAIFAISRFSNHISYFPPLLKVLRRVSECPLTYFPVSYPEYRLNVHRHLPLGSEERDNRFSVAECLHAWFCGRPRRHQVSMPNPARQQP